MAGRIVIIDSGIPSLLDNKIFVSSTAIQVSHTILPTCYLHQQAAKVGIELLTPDVYLARRGKEMALLVSHLTTGYTGLLLSLNNVKPVILTCQESPFVATRFYVDLKKMSASFKHSFVFSGMKSRLSKKTIYHQMFFPQAFHVDDFKPVSFKQKKFLVMISANKKISSWKKNLAIKLLYGWDVAEIYGLRRKSIDFFADKGVLDLYGRGWKKSDKNISKVYRGEAEEKYNVLRDYKFVFCFENAIFPGYVTEKIFDAMFAGCVPIYCGAPDVKKLIPADCFIDIRDFRNFSALFDFLQSIDEERYMKFLGSIYNYLISPNFYKFSQECFTKELLDIFEDNFKL